WLVGTDAATEITNLSVPTCGRISSTTPCTACGLTHRNTMSALRAALTLSVPTGIPSFFASAIARSSCCTVAEVKAGASSFFSSQAFTRIPPIFPAPSTATRFPDRFTPIPESSTPTLKCSAGILPAVPRTSCPRPHWEGVFHFTSSQGRSCARQGVPTRRSLPAERLNRHLHHRPPDGNRRGRRRRRHVVKMQHVLALRELEIIHHRPGAVNCLCPHARPARYQVFAPNLRQHLPQPTHERLFAHRTFKFVLAAAPVLRPQPPEARKRQ